MHDAAKHSTVKVTCKQTYDVCQLAGSYEHCCSLLNNLLGTRQRLLVTSSTVSSLYAEKIWKNIRGDSEDESFVILDCDENKKNLDQVTRICQKAQEVRLGRQGIIVAIGGGVCTDIATVAASWLHRGINYIKVPTTLIGQIDAGIGIKGAVNFNGQKNYLGCFHPPMASIITPFFLQTLSLRHLRSGIAEIAKMAIICDQKLFLTLEKKQQEFLASGFQQPKKPAMDVLWHSINAMLRELENNIYEDRSFKRNVDFGHTFSPAFEECSGFELTHGEAVAVDIALSTVLACHMLLLTWEVGERIISLLLDMGLPVWLPALRVELCQRALYDATLRRDGKINLVVPTSIASCTFIECLEDIPDRILEVSIEKLKKYSQVDANPKVSSS